MIGKTVRKDNKSRTVSKRKTRSDSTKINDAKLKKFCNMWSMDTPKETIMKTLKIEKSAYYNYIDAAEEIVDDFLLGMVDHGLILQFRSTLQRVQRRAEKLDELANAGLEKYEAADENEKLATDRLVRNANASDKLYNELLDDSKIVNQAVKTLNKVIVNNSKKKE